MATQWSLTIDCAYPAKLAGFWALALGYVQPPPPLGSTAGRTGSPITVSRRRTGMTAPTWPIRPG